MMEKNDMTFSLHLTLDGREHLVTAAAAAKEVQRAVDQSRAAYSSYTNICPPPPRLPTSKRVRVFLLPSYTFYA